MMHQGQKFVKYKGKSAFDKVVSETEIENYKKLGTHYNIPSLYKFYEEANEQHIKKR